ncbi:hypothetical protein ST47_g8171 [Ascochyta rabiei]|uniref:Uncharacterized protein n=1 Tax=Didymella rabiei TaxID=5454 RepID=A0A162ZL48_DIDRA|nr:hypothetical protein ST47_g8171 [Ascochyta rabiei]
MVKRQRGVETRGGHLGDVVCGEVRRDGEMRGGGGDFDDYRVCGRVLEERGCHDVDGRMLTSDKWGLLSAMQALTVHILVRLQEGETPDNSHDILLLSTLLMVTYALNEQVNFGPCIARSGLYHGSDGSEWIFEELPRRLALVYQILKMLYSLDPATFCAEPDGFLLAPLPGRKQLWEAPDDAQAWMAEKSRDGPIPGVFGVLTGGQMMRLQEQQVVLAAEMSFPLVLEMRKVRAIGRSGVRQLSKVTGKSK